MEKSVRFTCERCGKETIIVPAEYNWLNCQSGRKRVLRLVCPYCHRGVWRKEEKLRAEGKLV